MDEKTMQFANFNITFGAQDAAMLEHFFDVIFPAMTSGYVRGKANELPQYYFDNVCIRNFDNEFVLVGNYVKSTTYRVITTVQDGTLVSSPANVPTAPYSRFIVFLKNHRMILVKNESNSPDIRSFQKTFRDILNKYTKEQNNIAGLEHKLPFAVVHIVDIPFTDTIDEVLRDVDKINWMKLRFFPLNNDLDPLPLMRAVREEMRSVGSKTGNLIFNSPDSKDGVKCVINSTGGLAVATLKVTDADGETRKIKAECFSSNANIEYEGNVDANGDAYIIAQAQKNEAMVQTSPENESLYLRVKDRLRSLLN